LNGTRRAEFRDNDYYVHERVRDFRARRRKMHGRGTRRYSYEVVDGERGVLRLGHVR
jgi:RNA-directed DNA polymerase